MIKDFCAFILTHGRPDNVITYDTLLRHGYTGPIYIVIDNEDKTSDRYRKRFGDKVVMFDKLAVSKTFDEADNFNDRRAIVYARNACFDIAKELGYKYFIQLDDDYTRFEHRYIFGDKLLTKHTSNLDFCLGLMVEFLNTSNCETVAMAQGGDFIGGANNDFAKNQIMKRKAMNTFLCSTEKPFKFLGRINEDVNTYTSEASRGVLMFTIPQISIIQKQTQSNKGGMSDIYNIQGTYIKSFYTIIFSPSSVMIGLMGDKHKRLHHSINWINTVPKIIDQKHKKYE